MLKRLEKNKKKIGIGVGVLVGIGIVITLIWYFFIRKSGGDGPSSGCPAGQHLYEGKCIPDCPAGLQPCATGCYDPAIQECLINGYICSKGKVCTGGSQCCRPNEKCDPITDTCVKCDDRDTICSDGECCGQGHVCVSVGTQEICCATETVCGTDENPGCCDYGTYCDKTDQPNPVCKACPGDAPFCGGLCCVKGQECIKDQGICCDPDKRCGKDNNDCCYDGKTCCKGDKTTCISGTDKKCCKNELICSSDKKCCDGDNQECVAGVCCTPERKCENGTVCCLENQWCVDEKCYTPE